MAITERLKGRGFVTEGKSLRCFCRLKESTGKPGAAETREEKWQLVSELHSVSDKWGPDLLHPPSSEKATQSDSRCKDFENLEGTQI